MSGGLISCHGCGLMKRPARRDAVYCKPCAKKLYAVIDTGGARVAAMSDEEVAAAANETLSRIWRNNRRDKPADLSAGDGERKYANEMFTVTKKEDE